MESHSIVMNRLHTSLSSITSRELVELLDREKFDEFLEKCIGVMPFYYNKNILYYNFCNDYTLKAKL